RSLRRISPAMDRLTIRPAGPEELAELVSIDDDACALYAQAGLPFELAADHPFARAEYDRWQRAAAAGLAFLAGPPGASPVAMLALGQVGGASHVDQLSVRVGSMRRGIGSALLRRAIQWAAAGPLWLTTYAHLAWNRPFYERNGFEVVPDERCLPGIVARLE